MMEDDSCEVMSGEEDEEWEEAAVELILRESSTLETSCFKQKIVIVP